MLGRAESAKAAWAKIDATKDETAKFELLQNAALHQLVNKTQAELDSEDAAREKSHAKKERVSAANQSSAPAPRKPPPSPFLP